jgi:hypothetical protein
MNIVMKIAATIVLFIMLFVFAQAGTFEPIAVIDPQRGQTVSQIYGEIRIFTTKYKHPRKFEQKFCELNKDIMPECTDAYFRRLRADTFWRLPLGPAAYYVEGEDESVQFVVTFLRDKTGKFYRVDKVAPLAEVLKPLEEAVVLSQLRFMDESREAEAQRVRADSLGRALAEQTTVLDRRHDDLREVREVLDQTSWGRNLLLLSSMVLCVIVLALAWMFIHLSRSRESYKQKAEDMTSLLRKKEDEVASKDTAIASLVQRVEAEQFAAREARGMIQKQDEDMKRLREESERNQTLFVKIRDKCERVIDLSLSAHQEAEELKAMLSHAVYKPAHGGGDSSQQMVAEENKTLQEKLQ